MYAEEFECPACSETSLLSRADDLYTPAGPVTVCAACHDRLTPRPESRLEVGNS